MCTYNQQKGVIKDVTTRGTAHNPAAMHNRDPRTTEIHSAQQPHPPHTTSDHTPSHSSASAAEGGLARGGEEFKIGVTRGEGGSASAPGAGGGGGAKREVWQRLEGSFLAVGVLNVRPMCLCVCVWGGGGGGYFFFIFLSAYFYLSLSFPMFF